MTTEDLHTRADKLQRVIVEMTGTLRASSGYSSRPVNSEVVNEQIARWIDMLTAASTAHQAEIAECHDIIASLWARSDPEDQVGLTERVDAVLGAASADGHCGNHICAKLAECETEIARLQQQIPQWRDIETAPRDGTEILVLGVSGPAVVVWVPEHRRGEFKRREWRVTWSFDFLLHDPTHWMPLTPPQTPEPPTP